MKRASWRRQPQPQKPLLSTHTRRAIIEADRCLVFDPDTPPATHFLDMTLPKLEGTRVGLASAAGRGEAKGGAAGFESDQASLPFELEILEGGLAIATGEVA